MLEDSKGFKVSIHLEWNGETPFEEAWKKTKLIEEKIKCKFGKNNSLFVHFEPSIEKIRRSEKSNDESLKREIKRIIQNLKPPLKESTVSIIKAESKTYIHLTFPANPSLKIEEIHELSSVLENEIVKISPPNSPVLAQPVPEEFFKK